MISKKKLAVWTLTMVLAVALGASPQKTVGQVEFTLVPSGCFQMGSEKYDREKPVHKVCVKSFYMSTYEITQAQWTDILGTNPSYFQNGKNKITENTQNYPVDSTDYANALLFAEKFGNKYKVAASLPSEAQWEYAARARSNSMYYWGDEMNTEYAWCSRNSGASTHPVGQKKPNAFGLYDMSGNVLEWTLDCWHETYKKAPGDGSAWMGKNNGECSRHVLRGGAWNLFAPHLRSSFRIWDGKGSSLDFYHGVRLILPISK